MRVGRAVCVVALCLHTTAQGPLHPGTLSVGANYTSSMPHGPAHRPGPAGSHTAVSAASVSHAVGPGEGSGSSDADGSKRKSKDGSLSWTSKATGYGEDGSNDETGPPPVELCLVPAPSACTPQESSLPATCALSADAVARINAALIVDLDIHPASEGALSASVQSCAPSDGACEDAAACVLPVQLTENVTDVRVARLRLLKCSRDPAQCAELQGIGLTPVAEEGRGATKVLYIVLVALACFVCAGAIVALALRKSPATVTADEAQRVLEFTLKDLNVATQVQDGIIELACDDVPEEHSVRCDAGLTARSHPSQQLDSFRSVSAWSLPHDFGAEAAGASASGTLYSACAIPASGRGWTASSRGGRPRSLVTDSERITSPFTHRSPVPLPVTTGSPTRHRGGGRGQAGDCLEASILSSNTLRQSRWSATDGSSFAMDGVKL
eukprot:TRINITY_DN4867_c0_g1_i1.p1 TRINITY_DN4867_c0_g1~~TRINITY_DN4867_c0_g1_i1.p1  ORF type:complete len:440 (+),score=43.55 TRINITY_DN4867_c0_g1_i1:94-1413(+)